MASKESERHSKFAEETYSFMLNRYDEGESPKKMELFQPYIADALIVFRYVFRKDYWKTFNRIRENLKHLNMFEKYCRAIPVKKDNRYFYYYLLRMSLILELIRYCEKEGYDYFKMGRECAGECDDVQFFESSGGWRRLKQTAYIIATLGRPLALIMRKDIQTVCKNIVTITDAIEALLAHLWANKELRMTDSAEIAFFREIRDAFNTPSETDKPKDVCKIETEEETESATCRKITFNAVNSPKQQLDPELKMEIELTSYFRVCFLNLTSLTVLPKDTDELPKDVLLKCSESVAAEKAAVECSEENTLTVFPKDTDELPKDILLKCYESVAAEKAAVECFEENTEIENSEEILTERDIAKDVDQRSEEDKLDTNLIAQKECNNQPTFIVPREYLESSKSNSPSKSKYAYGAKMCPPSRRKNLDEHLKKILDESIESHNYESMPSGDMLVCPFGSPSRDEEALVIFAESSTDEEGDPDIDVLMCLFKKMELDSQGKETGYSLRPRQPKSTEKGNLVHEMDSAETSTREMTASCSGTPSKFSRRTKRKSPRSDRAPINETFEDVPYAKELTRLYKKYLASYVDECLALDFPVDKLKVQSSESSGPSMFSESSRSSESSTSSDLDYEPVFAVSAGIMARRKALRDTSEGRKPVLGIRLYESPFLKILKLNEQQTLDSYVEKGNYFGVSGMMYGVGPRAPAPLKSIWVILASGDGMSDSLEFSREDLIQKLHLLIAYEPVLNIFTELSPHYMEKERLLRDRIMHQLLQDLFS